MEAFAIQRSLLNAKFEGYRFEPLSQEEAVVRFDLPYKPSQATASGKVPLTFHEVQSRITHNHLALSNDTSQAVYIDSAYRVVLVNLLANPPSFRVVYELPNPVQSAESLTQREYPSAAFCALDVIFVADGNGLLYVLRLREEQVSDVIGVFTITPGSLEAPFRLHSLHRVAPDTTIAILSSRHYESALINERQSMKPGYVEFDIWGVKFDLSALPFNEVMPLQVLWQRKGREVPFYTNYNPELDAFLLIGGDTYRELAAPPQSSYEPSPDEYVPIPRANENLDSEKQDLPKPHPYSWTQMSDSVTVAFPLPSSTPKSRIKVVFSTKALTVHVDTETDGAIPMPNYFEKPLWDDIHPSSSYWTWDREAEHSFGLLTLHLDKANEGVRWMQVFAAAATASANPDDLEVPETLDPSELWKIREALEKYTAALRTGEDASGLGLGTGIPSLAEGEMDEEVDASVGREAYQTWVDVNGRVPAWWKNAREIPCHILSTPLPGQPQLEFTFIIKTGVDGAVFTLESAANPPKWKHSSTFSALSFVLASKRDTRFTFHTDTAVFAFEGGVRDRGGNVYIYRAAPLADRWAKQTIVKVDDGRGGSLLGVGAWNTAQGLVLVCLTEGELVLVKTP
ncbi:hypothetical protein AX17_006198 [Amanita inopinata Kibby_2008]|nr:hypothetical protein AX17_006198 [Amanita inopinata Kibby_2008]